MYRAATREIGPTNCHRPAGMRENNRADDSYRPIRRGERKQHKFKSQAPPSVSSPRAAVYNSFNVQQHLVSRPTLPCFRAVVHQTWAAAAAAA